MRADELMTQNVKKCSKDDSLEHAARIMWESDVGCLVVTDAEDHPIGMITDRDIAMAAYTQGAGLKDALVESAMAREVKTCAPDSALGDVEKVMRTAQIRRVPVVQEDGKLAGIVTLGDIARSSQSSPLRAAEIPGVAKTLAIVTEPRSVAAAAQ
jgi:CBS domain-containing protein